MRIIYMGTPEFACAPLRALWDAGHEIAAVFCQPDRPKGRGMKLVAPPVKELALHSGLPAGKFPRPCGEAGPGSISAGRHRCSGIWPPAASVCPACAEIWVHQYTRVASAEISRCSADSVRNFKRRQGNGRDGYAYGAGS